MNSNFKNVPYAICRAEPLDLNNKNSIALQLEKEIGFKNLKKCFS